MSVTKSSLSSTQSTEFSVSWVLGIAVIYTTMRSLETLYRLETVLSTVCILVSCPYCLDSETVRETSLLTQHHPRITVIIRGAQILYLFTKTPLVLKIIPSACSKLSGKTARSRSLKVSSVFICKHVLLVYMHLVLRVRSFEMYSCVLTYRLLHYDIY